MSTDHSVSDSYGNEDRANISSTFNEVDQASRMLQSRFGLRAEVADSIAVEKFVSGSARAEAGIGANFGAARIGASGSASAGITRRWTDNDVASVSRDGARIEDALNQWSSNRGWAKNRDTFDRSAVATSQSNISSRASGISSSITEAQNFSREARKFYEAANRLEQRWSVSNGDTVSGALNTSDAFLAFARDEIAKTPLVYGKFDPANATHWSSGEPQIGRERDMLLQRYVSHASNRMRTELAGHLVAPSPAGIDGLAIRGSGGARALRLDGEAAGSVANNRRATNISAEGGRIRAEVDAAQNRGEGRVSQSRRLRETDTVAVGPPTKTRADRARSWGRSDPQLSENKTRKAEDKPRPAR